MSERGYNSPIRVEQARLTRERLARAAAALFVERGYPSTTVAEVARAAGVSAQTVYNIFGGKPALLKAAHDITLAGDAAPVPISDRPDARAVEELTDARQLLFAYAELGRVLLERVGPLMMQVAAGATAGDPDLVAHQQVTNGERLAGTRQVAARVAELGCLRADLTVEQARDRIWTLNSVQVWHLLTGTLGWSGSQYQAWIGEAMCAAVLADPSGAD